MRHGTFIVVFPYSKAEGRDEITSFPKSVSRYNNWLKESINFINCGLGVRFMTSYMNQIESYKIRGLWRTKESVTQRKMMSVHHNKFPYILTRTFISSISRTPKKLDIR